MIKSMTAYGRSEYESNNRVFIAEIKSLNNRYRDIILRLPSPLQGMEDEIRSQISSRVKRGRVELSIKIENNSGLGDYILDLNRPLLKSYLDIFKKMEDEFGLIEKIRPIDLCQIKDIILTRQEEMDLDESRESIREVLEQAFNSLDTMRSREGKAIEADFIGRLKLIEGFLDNIEERAPVVVKEYKEKLKLRIENLSREIEIDEERLAQETALFASKCDITEEIVRSRSHLEQFLSYLSFDDSVGRRLDFLIQEINREINTISSKASDSSISFYVVEVKAELEKLKEQIQNVE